MPGPFFISAQSQMDVEALYIQELNPPGLKTGVSLNKLGVGGVTVRGPTGGVAVGSPADFLRIFGGRDYGAGGAYVNEVHKFLLNKRFGEIVVFRAVAADAVKASFTMETAAGGAGTAVLRIDAASVGIWGNDVQAKVATASDADANHFDLTIRYLGVDYLLKNVDISSTNDNLAAKISEIWDADGALISMTKLAAGRPVSTAAGIDGADAEAFVNLGETVAGFTSVAGSNGTIADSDFTGADKVIDQLAGYKGLYVCALAGRSNATVKAAIKTVAAAGSDRIWLICPDSDTTAKSAAITDVANYRTDKARFIFNHHKTLDRQTGEVIFVEPHSWSASIITQTDVKTHTGHIENSVFTAGSLGLKYESLTKADYAAFRAAGISAFEKDEDGNIVEVSSLTTSLTSGKEEFARRRMTDELQLLAAKRLKPLVKSLGSEMQLEKCKAELVGISEEKHEKNGEYVKDYSVKKTSTQAQEDAGTYVFFWQVKLLSHILKLLVTTQIGTGVTIEEA